MTEWTPEATARYHDELQRLRAETPTADDYEAQLALCRNLYDELYSQTEQLRNERDALLAERQQLQELLADTETEKIERGTKIIRLEEQRQQAIDALREISQARSSRGPGVMGETVEGLAGFADAALVKLGEKP